MKLHNIILIVKSSSLGVSSSLPVRESLECGFANTKRPSPAVSSVARRRDCGRCLPSLTTLLLNRLKGSARSSEFCVSQAATRSQIARSALSNQIQALTPDWIASASCERSCLFSKEYLHFIPAFKGFQSVMSKSRFPATDVTFSITR